MTVYVLSGYVSPSPEAPAFIIPTFTCRDSNQIFAQNLDRSGSIISFLPIDAKLFYNVPELPMSTTRSVGQKGVLAFWREEGGVLAGEAPELRDLLSNHLTDDPFAELEIGSFLKNSDRQLSAIDAVADILGDRSLSQRWRGQEIAALAIPIVKHSHGNKNAEELSFESEFEYLLSDSAAEDWPDRWTFLWQRKYNIPSLEDLVFWWTDLGPGQTDIAAPVYFTLARAGKDQRLLNYVIKWLENNNIHVPLWGSIWSSAHSRFGNRNQSALTELALRQLRSSVATMNRIPYGWSTTWYYLWLTNEHRDECLDLAAYVASKVRTVSRSFADFVIDIALNHPKCPQEIVNSSQQWLRMDMRSVVLWAQIFIKTYRRSPNPELLQVGITWLEYYGGNVNIWLDVWKLLQIDMMEERWVKLSKDWLARARWDLSSWPVVYNEVCAKLRDSDLNYFEILGNNWQNYQKNYPNNSKKIRQAMKLIASRLEESA